VKMKVHRPRRLYTSLRKRDAEALVSALAVCDIVAGVEMFRYGRRMYVVVMPNNRIARAARAGVIQTIAGVRSWGFLSEDPRRRYRSAGRRRS